MQKSNKKVRYLGKLIKEKESKIWKLNVLWKPTEYQTQMNYCEIQFANCIIWVFCGIFCCSLKALMRQAADIGLDGEREREK